MSQVEFEKAFLKAQKEMKAAVKDASNPYFKSKYTDYETLVETVKGPLNSNGLTFRHSSSWYENGYFVGTKLFHADTGYHGDTFEVPTKVGNPQETGSAITYAKRYSLASICGLPSSEDDDGNAASGKKDPNIYYTATDEQKIDLAKAADHFGVARKDKDTLVKLSQFLIDHKVPMAKLNKAIEDFLK